MRAAPYCRPQTALLAPEVEQLLAPLAAGGAGDCAASDPGVLASERVRERFAAASRGAAEGRAGGQAAAAARGCGWVQGSRGAALRRLGLVGRFGPREWMPMTARQCCERHHEPMIHDP